MLEIRLLGQFNVAKNGEPVEIPSRPSQSLLAFLVLKPGIDHRREKLAGLFWPDSNETQARTYLRRALWQVRKSLTSETSQGDEYLLADKISVTFNPEAEYWLDAAQLESTSEPEIDRLMQDLSVYGGELLPGFYDDWTVLDRERLRAIYTRKAELLLEGLLEHGRWRDTIEWGERWIALGHAPEQAFRAMMIASAGLGDMAAVSSIYERCQTALMEEHAVEPSAQTQEAYRSLSQGGAPQALLKAPSREDSAVEAARRLMEQWKAKSVDSLDVASLAVMHALPEEVTFGREEASLLIRSALRHGIELQPWLGRAETDQAATAALLDGLQDRPEAKVRLKIVQALATREGDPVERELLSLVQGDESSSVRAAAAVAAAKRGRAPEVLGALSSAMSQGQDSAALDAFVAVADEVGLPEPAPPYPRLAVGMGLLRRRWRSRGEDLRRTLLWGALGGALGMIAVANGQLLPAYVLAPEVVQKSLEVVALPVWIFSNTLMGALWGGAFGAALAGGHWLAHTFWRGKAAHRWRLALGGVAGLVHGAFLVLLSAIQALTPRVSAALYFPVYMVYGFLVGLFISFAVAPAGEAWKPGKLAARVLIASALIALAALPTVAWTYQRDFADRIILDFMFAAIFPLAMALSLRRAGRSVTIAGMPDGGA